jgi:integrase/recombinase XerD
MANGGFRIGGLLSCQIKSVKFEKYGAITFFNPEGTNKTTGAMGTSDLVNGYLNQWLALHPYRDNPNAPFFCGTVLT